MVETAGHSLVDPTTLVLSGAVRMCTDVDTKKEVGLLRLHYLLPLSWFCRVIVIATVPIYV
jgi:hypothetical protein